MNNPTQNPPIISVSDTEEQLILDVPVSSYIWA